MKKAIYQLLFYFIPAFVHAQEGHSELQTFTTIYPGEAIPLKRKLYQQNYGAILGMQRGAYGSIEMGAEAHWRKLSLANPAITGATANLNYNFGNHVVGYQGGMWMKHGRVNLTYGANLLYYSNFHGLEQYGGGPAVGFRLAGFHLINGFNFLSGDDEMVGANKLYMTLRYYFPVANKFTWDRKTMQHKRERIRDKEKRKKQREEAKTSAEKKSFWKIFNKDQ
ncbi:MAG: hypothetical protein ACM3VS_05635 [Candidatus Dadabacteria bacterium]